MNVKTAKNLMVALAESVARDVLPGWRWFSDDDWIVFEVPGRREISLPEMQALAAQPHVTRVAAVFRATPHAGVYVRFQLRKTRRKTKGAKSPPPSTRSHDAYDNSIGGPNDYAYGM